MGARRALLAGLVAIAGYAARLPAQVSPGPLARAHRELEGPLKCIKCHAGGSVTMEQRCIACHGDIGWLAQQGRGIHGAPAAKGAKCASCHPDHAGDDFALIQWTDGSPERFDHRRAGWVLQASHTKLGCGDCHKAANRVSPATRLAPGGQSNWTGLEQTCASCHEDVHRGALGSRCQACHDAGKWTSTPGFSHDTTRYPLTGRHTQVSCAACHASTTLTLRRDATGHPIPLYKPLPHASCASCHADVHQGSFGPNCTTCHVTRSFTEITGGGFDHSRTSFALKGRHAAVACGSCHRDFTSDRGRHPVAISCATCHAPDPHAGTATLQGKPADCSGCHDERGFTPAMFSVERHRTSAYPLEGKHVAVKCASCHRKEAPASAARLGSARVVLRPAFATCTSCHADDHGGQLAARAGKGECAECHAVAGWRPSRFGRVAHAKLSLPLEGRHAEVACGSCHAERKGLKPLPTTRAAGKAGFKFTGIETRCAQCHVDPHGGRFEPTGERPSPASCSACHTTTGFRPAAIDPAAHDRFRFVLRGAHRATPCYGCHRELANRPALPSTLVAGSGTVSAERFLADSTCASCHQSVHGSQFDTRKDKGRCDACHGEESFKPASRFDHDREASFALGKGHAPLPCGSCHKAERLGGGVLRVIYRPLSGKCESCHKNRPG